MKPEAGMTVKAIETSYGGCRFRSRLEARWAVFFDALGIAWDYEPQGYELPSGKLYLPDFVLPEMDVYVEVKGDDQELRANEARYAESAHHLGGRGLLLLGPIPDLRLGVPQHFVITRKEHCCGKQVLCLHSAWDIMLTIPDGVREYGFHCTGIVSHDPTRLPLPGTGVPGRATWLNPGPIDWPIGEDVEAAYRSARSARFEHGERG